MTEDEQTNLRERARRHLDVAGLSQAAFSRQSGISSSTFSAWLNGTYKGDNAAVAGDVRTYLDAQAQRAQMILPEKLGYVSTPSSKKILTALETAQWLPEMVVVAAGPGVGKTTTARNYRDTHPNTFMITASPALTKARHVLEALAEVLGLTETTPRRIARAIETRLKDTGALLIVDEAQFLAAGGVEQLRSLYDQANVGVAMMGNEEVWSKIDGGGRKALFAQVHSRVGVKVRLARPATGDIDAILDAVGVVDTAQRALLHQIANKPGALRGLEKVLRIARMVANGAGVEMTREHIMAAWQRFAGTKEIEA